MAAAAWPGQNPVGKRVMIMRPSFEDGAGFARTGASKFLFRLTTPSSLFQIYSTSRIERDTLALQQIALFPLGTGR